MILPAAFVIGFVALAVLAESWILIRVPARLTSISARLEEVELRLATLDAQLKKAVRRWGIDVKAAARGAEPTTVPPGEVPPSIDLDAVREHFRQRYGA